MVNGTHTRPVRTHRSSPTSTAGNVSTQFAECTLELPSMAASGGGSLLGLARHTIYTRMNRWAKGLDSHLSENRSCTSRRSRWTTIVKGTKKNGPQSIGKSTTKIHMVAADARTAMTFSLSPTGPRRTGGPQAAPPPGASAKEPVYSDGSCIRGQRDAPTRIGVGTERLGRGSVTGFLLTRADPWD